MARPLMGIRPVYWRLVVVITFVLAIAAVFVGHRASQAYEVVSAKDLAAQLPYEYTDIKTCEARLGEKFLIRLTDGSDFQVCLYNQADKDLTELTSALRRAGDAHMRSHAIKAGTTFFAASLSLVVIALLVVDWVARGAGHGFLFSEPLATPVFRGMKRTLAVVGTAIAVMTGVLCVGNMKQALFATAEFPAMGFLIAWVIFELRGKPLNLLVAFVSHWLLILAGIFLVFPAKRAFGDEYLGLMFAVVAAGIIVTTRATLPVSISPSPAYIQSRWIRSGIAILLSFVFGILLIIPIEISDLIRNT